MIRFKEPFNGISHLIGACLSVAATVVLVRAGAQRGGGRAAVAMLVYGCSMFLLYSASAWYHLLDVGASAHRVLRRLDHVSISLLIAGTYTPICVLVLPGRAGTTLLWEVWLLALALILTDIFWIDAPRALKAALYVVLGWVAVWAVVPLVKAVGWSGVFWVLGSGLTYSVGALLYAIKKPNPWPGVFGFHEIWHLFVLGGSTGFVIFMWRYVLPLVARPPV
jgi:hemolysin III